MCVQRLLSYFESDIQQRRALDAVTREGWLEPGRNLDFYGETWRAFDPSASADEAFRAFGNIYRELKGPTWQVFRSNKGNLDHWNARQVFETINREFSEFA